MFFSNRHTERLSQLFGDKFEPDGIEFLYRKTAASPPIRVTEAERTAFVDTFNRRLRHMFWPVVPATLLLGTLIVILFPDVKSVESNIAMWVGLGLILTGPLSILYWAWNEPDRKLKIRPAEGPARTSLEVQQLAFSKIGYRQLALGILSGPALVWMMSSKHDVLHGWGTIWLVIGGLLTLVGIVQAIRKWMFEQQHPRSE